MRSEGISLKSGKSRETLKKEDGCLRSGSGDSISLKLAGKIDQQASNPFVMRTGRKNEERSRDTIRPTSLIIEVTSKTILEEKNAKLQGRTIWPVDAEVTLSGRTRIIEADPDTIEEIYEWAESKGMNVLSAPYTKKETIRTKTEEQNPNRMVHIGQQIV
jgi:hypothetical protein